MSYYTFNQPIQGGGFGPSWDDEMRKRRKHYRDAGAPYQGGSSGIQTTPQRLDIGALLAGGLPEREAVAIDMANDARRFDFGRFLCF